MKKSENIVPAVEKTIILLEYLGGETGVHGASQAELSAALDISTSSCYRILQSLQNANWVRRDSSGKYFIANGILKATESFVHQNFNFDKFQILIDRLTQVSGLSCKISVRCGYEQITVLRGESPQKISISSKVGSHFPLIEGSVGAALLSKDSREDIMKIAALCNEDLAEKNSPELIFEQVKKVKDKGCYLSLNGENRWNVCAFSMPIHNSCGDVIAALTMLGWPESFSDEALLELKKLMLERIDFIENNL